MSGKQTTGRFFLGALLGLMVLSSVGCTLNSGGMPLPNPHYFDNRVQYFPPGNEFPFSREEANMQAAEPDRS